MDTNRRDDRVFGYVRDILSAQRRDSGVPVVFGLARVPNATARFTSYLGYLLAGAPEPRTGELKRAVRELFEGIDDASIGDGTVPKLDGATLSASQVAELACHVISLDERIPSTSTPSSRRQWRSTIMSWKKLFVSYNDRNGSLWDGFKKTSFAANGSPVLVYRIFLLASGVACGTRFDPAHLMDAALPRANGNGYATFKNAVARGVDCLDADIRARIWRGFRAERNSRYLAAGVPKPGRKPKSAAAMLEMFECYFNGRASTYDRRDRSGRLGKALGIAQTIARRYWPMMGSIAIGPLMCTDTTIGVGALVLLLVLWSHRRHSPGSTLDPVRHWGPFRTVAYTSFCAYAGEPPLLVLATAVPIAVFAAHLARKWDEIRAVA